MRGDGQVTGTYFPAVNHLLNVVVDPASILSTASGTTYLFASVTAATLPADATNGVRSVQSHGVDVDFCMLISWLLRILCQFFSAYRYIPPVVLVFICHFRLFLSQGLLLIIVCPIRFTLVVTGSLTLTASQGIVGISTSTTTQTAFNGASTCDCLCQSGFSVFPMFDVCSKCVDDRLQHDDPDLQRFQLVSDPDVRCLGVIDPPLLLPFSSLCVK